MDSAVLNAVRGMNRSSESMLRTSVNVVNAFNSGMSSSPTVVQPAQAVNSPADIDARFARLPLLRPEFTGLINNTGSLTADAFLAAAEESAQNAQRVAAQVQQNLAAQSEVSQQALQEATAQFQQSSRPDPVRSMVDMVQAQNAFEANAQSFRIASDVEDTLFDALA